MFNCCSSITCLHWPKKATEPYNKTNINPSSTLIRTAHYLLLSTNMSPIRNIPSPPRKSSTDTLPGFIKPPKQKSRPIDQLTLRELNDLHNHNARILSGPSPSTSTYVQRISAEQDAIEARLALLREQENIESIRVGIKNTYISSDEDMNIDLDSEPSFPGPIAAKRRALMRYATESTSSSNGGLSFQEAVRIEQEAHALDLARQQHAEERKRRLGLPIKGEVLSKEATEARIWAFMNYKPTDSDLEDDDDEDDDDPATWFEDDEDDGIKGQQIVEPDLEDLSNIIRIDESRALNYSTFYEPRDD